MYVCMYVWTCIAWSHLPTHFSVAFPLTIEHGSSALTFRRFAADDDVRGVLLRPGSRNERDVEEEVCTTRRACPHSAAETAPISLDIIDVARIGRAPWGPPPQD
jgi:hypothetical protein